MVVGTPHAKKAFFALDGLEPMPQLNRSDRQNFFFLGLFELMQ